jgi:hypothetical protein
MWTKGDRFLEIRSHWLTLIGERYRDDQGRNLEYWRVERADSVIILPIQANHLILPPKSYRPGVDALTLDFPGGRMLKSNPPETSAIAILHRELGVAETDISFLLALNHEGWAVNSSFSNQKLYGFIAEIQPDALLPSDRVGATYPATSTGVHDLLQELTCLQCRAILLEWWMRRGIT